MSRVMTPEHPRWEEFVNLLQGEEGCDWQHVPVNEVMADGTVKDNEIDWDFPGKEGDEYLDICRKILKKMDGIDVQGSLRYFRDCGAENDAAVVSLLSLIDMKAPSDPKKPSDSEADGMFK